MVAAVSAAKVWDDLNGVPATASRTKHLEIASARRHRGKRRHRSARLLAAAALAVEERPFRAAKSAAKRGALAPRPHLRHAIQRRHHRPLHRRPRTRPHRALRPCRRRGRRRGRRLAPAASIASSPSTWEAHPPTSPSSKAKSKPRPTPRSPACPSAFPCSTFTPSVPVAARLPASTPPECSASVPNPPEPIPVPSATDAARSRRSPTPIFFSAASNPPDFSAETSRSISIAPAASPKNG